MASWQAAGRRRGSSAREVVATPPAPPYRTLVTPAWRLAHAFCHDGHEVGHGVVVDAVQGGQ